MFLCPGCCPAGKASGALSGCPSWKILKVDTCFPAEALEVPSDSPTSVSSNVALVHEAAGLHTSTAGKTVSPLTSCTTMRVCACHDLHPSAVSPALTFGARERCVLVPLALTIVLTFVLISCSPSCSPRAQLVLTSCSPTCSPSCSPSRSPSCSSRAHLVLISCSPRAHLVLTSCVDDAHDHEARASALTRTASSPSVSAMRDMRKHTYHAQAMPLPVPLDRRPASHGVPASLPSSRARRPSQSSRSNVTLALPSGSIRALSCVDGHSTVVDDKQPC